MNLLTDPVFTFTPGNARLTLPGVLAALACGEVQGFPALRSHQHAPWHQFLTQLATLALWHAGRSGIPEDAATWADLLRGLTPEDGDDAPWCLAAPPERPAFLQPPAVNGVTWHREDTPDAIDLLITSRNHDLKQAVATDAAAEDWAYALIALQTQEGYGGAGNYGIARMNGGSSSRPCLGLAPAGEDADRVDPSAWWRRDVARLLAARPLEPDETPSDRPTVGTLGGPALLWCRDWPEGGQLDLRNLDPLFIEVCRRIRLTEGGGTLHAWRATSRTPRIDAKAFKGNVGDPWIPVHGKEGKAFTLSGGDFTYAKINELIYSGNWTRPPLAEPEDDETGDMLLIAEALARGNAKTEGWKQRIIRVPGEVVSIFHTTTAGDLAKVQAEAEIPVFDRALRDGLALAAADGQRDTVGRQHYTLTQPARRRFDRVADRLFYPSLWRRLALRVQEADEAAQREARDAFLRDLLTAARHEFNRTLPAIPRSSTRTWAAEVRAERAFHGTIRKQYPKLYEKETADAA